jgi:N-acetylmuramoyl-L-alanine amidase
VLADDVLPLAPGAEGEAVRDVQRRLGEVGLDLGDDPSGIYGAATAAAVKAFQDQTGLPPDGVCGPLTWGALVEAGYRLGDRFLSHRTPMLRGDDVAEVQRQLGILGFDAGRVDGIFGHHTAVALEEFQRNSGLTPDGICGTDTVTALRRLAGRRAGPTNVAQAREVEAQRTAPRQLLERRVVVGAASSIDALADRLQRLLADAGAVVAVLHQPDGSAQARAANELGAELYVGLRLLPDPVCRVSYYATVGFESVGGRRLAELTSDQVGTVLESSPVTAGMRLPVLRETRMPAVQCELGPADEVVVRASEVAAALAAAVSDWIEHRLD